MPAENGTACERCGREPEADPIRYSARERADQVLDIALCPECSYGLNTLLRAYVANRDVSVR